MREAMHDTRDELLSRALHAAVVVLLLTSVHHAYGAYVYATLWRLHVVIVAGLTALALRGAAHVVRHRPAGLARTIATVAFCLVDLIIPVAGIGFFEGGYNHLLKNALYFGGASPQVMTRLFPPPAYELPGDWFFEGTGILQFVVGAFAAYRLYRFTRDGMHPPR
jgi:hypothetical protein